jgi:hypothetical protein
MLRASPVALQNGGQQGAGWVILGTPAGSFKILGPGYYTGAPDARPQKSTKFVKF